MNDGYDMISTEPGSLRAASDWFEESGRIDEATALRTGAAIPERIVPYGDGDGSGYGYGYGSGSGYGDGSLQSAINVLFHPEILTVNECDPGQLYMFALGEGWMFVGRFVRPVGLFGAVFSDVVNVCRTGGTPWDDLVRGNGRDRATFRAYPPGETPFPIVRFAFRWTGELPRTNR